MYNNKTIPDISENKPLAGAGSRRLLTNLPVECVATCAATTASTSTSLSQIFERYLMDGCAVSKIYIRIYNIMNTKLF